MKPNLSRRLETSSARFARVYGLMLMGLMVALSIAIAATVGLSAMHNTHSQANYLLKGLKNTYVASKGDWYWWRAGSPIDTKTTFIKATTTLPKKTQVTTRHTKAFVAKTDDAKQIWGDLYYSSDAGFYYCMTTTQTVDGAHGDVKVHYYLWKSLQHTGELLSLLFRIILTLMLIFFLLGTWAIYGLAKRLNRPLVRLTTYTQRVNQADQPTDTTRLPVPEKPAEVHELSVAFNDLLSSINKQTENDRQFVSNVSHELKTPIAGIRGNVELINRHGESDPAVIPDALKAIDHESLRMQRMIESLLSLSHASQLSIEREATDLVPIVAKVVADYQRQIPQDIMLVTDDSVIRQVNADTVEQIFLALLNNASKYSPTSGVITVRVAANEISVSDVGSGIPDSEKAKVFDRFYRAPQAKKGVTGTGLGLAIVKQLITLNHGAISIKDNAPSGSRFIIDFPAKS